MKSERLWNANYLKVWSANFMLYFSFMVVTPLFPLYLSEVFGATKDETGMVLSGYALTALLIRPFSGFFVDWCYSSAMDSSHCSLEAISLQVPYSLSVFCEHCMALRWELPPSPTAP